LPDPLAYLRLKGARSLPPDKRGVLQALFEWREKTAQETDRPPFRVISNEALMELSALASTTWDNLGRIRGVTPRLIARFGDEILTAIRRGLEEGEKRPPKSDRKRRPREIWTDEMEARFQRLREWRNRRAQEMNVEPFIVASSRMLETLARESPASLEALHGIPDLGTWRVHDYGEEILAALGNGHLPG
jgi:ribonuclease D